MYKFPSILNDVIGPVMRGSSSSHTAATWRIAKICLDILNDQLKSTTVTFDKDGVWANNFREQGTSMGIEGGLLGLDITDARMKKTSQIADEKRISIDYQIKSFPTSHTNTVLFTLYGLNKKKKEVEGVSLGGGAFEIRKVNKFNVNIRGDYFELLIFCSGDDILSKVKSIFPKNVIVHISTDADGNLINLKSPEKFPDELLSRLRNTSNIKEIVTIDPVMPVISGRGTNPPFTTVSSLLKKAEKEKLDLGQLGIIYEECRSGLSYSELEEKITNIINIIDNSISNGMKGTKYKDRILHRQSHLIKKAVENKKILNNNLINNTITYVSAIMESKSAMEVIVANPTAGSCGAIGGVLKAVGGEINSSQDEIIKAYFAAGLIGTYIAAGPGFSAEEHGCQVECGAASGMAAAGIVQLLGGTAKQAVDAASMAIQNMLGLICDPVADRVEVPCLGKNINAAMNALASATMTCSGFEAVIPLEQVIQTISEVSEHMPVCVKCTGKGGLATTQAALDIKNNLHK